MNLRNYIPAITLKSNGVLSPLSKEQRQRQKLYAAYWSYYKGNHRKPIKVRQGQADDNVIENWSKKIVNHGVNFLFGKGVKFQTDDNPERNEIETYLDEFWQDDAARGFYPSLFLIALAQNGGVTGTPVLRLYPPRESDKFPIIRAIDPSIIDVVTDPDDTDNVIAYHLTWKSGEKWKRHRIEKDENGLTWTIYEEEHNQRDWTVTDTIVWEYDFSPVMHTQNLVVANEVYGSSDLEDADLNDAINFVASNNNRITRFHAHPKTIGTGFSSKELAQTAVDQFWTVPAPDAKVFNLEMQSDLASSMQHLRNLEEAYHQVSDVPRLDPQAINLGALSGFALRILYGPLLSKTETKRMTYGSLLQRLNRAILILGGFQDPPTVRNVWPYPLPVNPIERAQEFQTLTANPDVDAYEAAIVAGYDEATAKRLIKDGLDTFLIPDTPTAEDDEGDTIG